MNEYRRCGIYTYNTLLLSRKEEWNIAICSNMDGPRDYHTKWSKSDRERQLYDIIYMWSLKKYIHQLIYKTETYRPRKETYGYQRGKGRGRGKLGVQD